MALDMQAAMRSVDEMGHLGLELRVGINSRAGRGRRDRPEALPVRPLGRRGEHRESHGVPRDLGADPDRPRDEGAARDEFVCEPRGTIPVKGKGEVETWYLVGRRASVAAEPGADPEPVRPPEAVPGG